MSMPVAMMIFSAVSSVVQASQQSDAAQAQAAAAAQNAQAAIDEATRQQAENNRVASEKKSDRMRQLDEDLGRARVASAEGFGMLGREIADLGYVGGLDISRIEANRASMNNSLQARKVAAQQGAVNAADAANRTSTAAFTGGIFNAIGSGLKIGAQDAANKRIEDAARNRNPSVRYEDAF